MKAARFNPLAFHPEGPGLRRSRQRPPPAGGCRPTRPQDHGHGLPGLGRTRADPDRRL